MTSQSERPSTDKINTADTGVTAKALKGAGIAKMIADYRKAYDAFLAINGLKTLEGIGGCSKKHERKNKEQSGRK